MDCVRVGRLGIWFVLRASFCFASDSDMVVPDQTGFLGSWFSASLRFRFLTSVAFLYFAAFLLWYGGLVSGVVFLVFWYSAKPETRLAALSFIAWVFGRRFFTQFVLGPALTLHFGFLSTVHYRYRLAFHGQVLGWSSLSWRAWFIVSFLSI